MSHFIHNGPCPKCRTKGEDTSKDNLATYSDGGTYCFKCGYTTKGDKATQLKKEKEYVSTADDSICPDTCVLSSAVIKYFKSYGLTAEEIEQNFKGHEDGYVFQTSNFYLIRRLHKTPKVVTHGNVVGNEPIFLSKMPSTTVIICEDVISAIKISRVCNSCALLKTHIHDQLLWRLASYFNTCILWLDADMYTHMTEKLYPKVSPYFKSTKIIFSGHDPKVYSTKEIKTFIDL